MSQDQRAQLEAQREAVQLDKLLLYIHLGSVLRRVQDSARGRLDQAVEKRDLGKPTADAMIEAVERFEDLIKHGVLFDEVLDLMLAEGWIDRISTLRYLQLNCEQVKSPGFQEYMNRKLGIPVPGEEVSHG